MIDIQKIKELTKNSKLIEFAEFVIAETGDKDFPDYKKMDLMKIASLVTHIWVFDFRNGVENDVPLIFSGTHVDSHHGRNVTGLLSAETYAGDDYEIVIDEIYFNVYRQKKTAYTKRIVHYLDGYIDKIKIAESMLFPCSNNNNDIDYEIGFSEYSIVYKSIVAKYVLL